MRKPEDGKKVYDNIEIPEELNNVVKDAIHSMDKGKSIKKHRTHNAVRRFSQGKWANFPLSVPSPEC